MHNVADVRAVRQLMRPLFLLNRVKYAFAASRHPGVKTIDDRRQ
jgi:hypothetical protein